MVILSPVRSIVKIERHTLKDVGSEESRAPASSLVVLDSDAPMVQKDQGCRLRRVFAPKSSKRVPV